MPTHSECDDGGISLNIRSVRHLSMLLLVDEKVKEFLGEKFAKFWFLFPNAFSVALIDGMDIGHIENAVQHTMRSGSSWFWQFVLGICFSFLFIPFYSSAFSSEKIDVHCFSCPFTEIFVRFWPRSTFSRRNASTISSSVVITIRRNRKTNKQSLAFAKLQS